MAYFFRITFQSAVVRVSLVAALACKQVALLIAVGLDVPFGYDDVGFQSGQNIRIRTTRNFSSL